MTDPVFRIDDTRLDHGAALIAAARDVFTDLEDELGSLPHVQEVVAAINNCLDKARSAVKEIRACGIYNSVGSRCALTAGHQGSHQAIHGFEWTDESDRQAAASIAKSLVGRRD